MKVLIQKRQEVIDSVKKDLESLRNNSKLNRYAIDENIAFFDAIRSIFKYIRWLLIRAPKIDGKSLLEINDLLPQWDESMHRKLMEVERKEFPGLIAPLVKQLSNIILGSKVPLILVNLGCGGMETERQIIDFLLKNKFSSKITFVGIDRSEIASRLIINNIKAFGDMVDFFAVDNLDDTKLVELRKTSSKKYLIIFCKNNIFDLDKYFSQNVFDITFHALFRHHLSEKDRLDIDVITEKLSKSVIEYDGYLSRVNIIPQTIAGWNAPVFLNAAIFSHLRFLRKKDLLVLNKNKKILFTKIGYYLLKRK